MSTSPQTCVVCQQPITTTGTAGVKGPMHIGCWHKATHSSPEIVALKERIIDRIDAMSKSELEQLLRRLGSFLPEDVTRPDLHTLPPKDSKDG